MQDFTTVYTSVMQTTEFAMVTYERVVLQNRQF